MVDAVLDRFDVAVEHRRVCLEAGLVDLAGDSSQRVAVAFVIADPRTRRFSKDLGTAAGTRIHSGSVQFFDHVLVRHLVKPRQEIELDHRQGFEMQCREFAFERREKVGVIRERKFAVQSADDVQLGRTFVDRLAGDLDAFLDECV